MKLFLDFLPLILFFGVFQYADKNKAWAADLATHAFGFMVSGGIVGAQEAPVLLATVVMSIITLLQVLVLKLMRRPVHLMLWITLALVIVLGGATIWFHDPMIIKWKPTIAYWSLGLSFWVSRMAFGRGPSGQSARCGGWGPVCGDEGSGQWVGRRALSVVTAAADGREPETAPHWKGPGEIFSGVIRGLRGLFR